MNPFGHPAEGKTRSMPSILHGHDDNGTIHFYIDNLTSVGSPHRFIIIDASDTTNYPHENTEYLHIDWAQASVDSDVNGEYTLGFSFLENVDASNGDRHGLFHISGAKKVGNSQSFYQNMSPNGHKLRSDKHTSHDVDLNDAAYANTVSWGSTLNPSSVSYHPGSGDFIVEIIVTAGTIDVAVDVGYHSHIGEH